MKNWRELLYNRWDSDSLHIISDYIASNTEVFDEVFDAFYAKDGHVAHRSGFILGQVFKKKPTLLIPKIRMLLKKMQEPPHDWYRWMTIWYLSHANFPKEHDGLAVTYAFEELGKSSSKPALKNACMRLLEFICKRNPELISEYQLYLDDIIENERPTLVSKAKKQMIGLKALAETF